MKKKENKKIMKVLYEKNGEKYFQRTKRVQELATNKPGGCHGPEERNAMWSARRDALYIVR